MFTRAALVCIAVFAVSHTLLASSNDPNNRITPIVKAYQKVEQSVVNISGTRKYRTQRPAYDFFFGPRRFGRKNIVQRFELGSGVVVHEHGYVVTNAHVVETAGDIHVTFSNAKEYKAEVIQVDKSKDLAFLKIDSDEKFQAVELGKSCDILIGETVIAVGNPFGYSSTVTEGIVSAIGRDIQVEKDFWVRGLIQTSAPINPGNSGGPLININGRLIGINTAIRAEAQNIGFAIPVDTMADNLIHMLMPEEMRRVKLGLVIGRMACNEDVHGLKVESVFESSPAQKQGVKPGDLIVSIDGKDVKGFIDFYVKMMEKEIGDKVKIEYVRPNVSLSKRYSAVLEIKPRPIPDGVELAREFFQVEIAPLDEDRARKYEFDRTYNVLIVDDVFEDGIAGQAGLRAGDVILQFNNASISNVKELSLAIEKVKEGDEVTLRILRIGWSGRYQVQREYLVKLKATKRKVKKSKYLLEL